MNDARMNDAHTVDARTVTDALYAQDTASQALGIEVTDVGPGRATTTMTVRADMTNGHSVCHGGLIFTLADTAMAFASNSHNEEALAAAAAIDFLAPAPLGAVLTAVATEQTLRGRSGIYDVTVSDHTGATIALFRGRTRKVGRVIVQPDR